MGLIGDAMLCCILPMRTTRAVACAARASVRTAISRPSALSPSSESPLHASPSESPLSSSPMPYIRSRHPLPPSCAVLSASCSSCTRTCMSLTGSGTRAWRTAGPLAAACRRVRTPELLTCGLPLTCSAAEAWVRVATAGGRALQPNAQAERRLTEVFRHCTASSTRDYALRYQMVAEERSCLLQHMRPIASRTATIIDGRCAPRSAAGRRACWPATSRWRARRGAAGTRRLCPLHAPSMH